MNRTYVKMFSFLFYYFKIFGNGFISFKFIKNDQTNDSHWEFVYSKFGNLYNIILSFFLSAVSIIWYADYVYDYNSKTVSTIDVWKFIHVIYLISMFGIVVVLFSLSIKAKEYISIINKFNFLNQYSNIEPIIKKNFTIVIVALPLKLLQIAYNSRHMLMYGVPTFFAMILMFFNFSIFFFLNSVLMHFSFQLQLVKNCLKSINNDLDDMLKRNDFSRDINKYIDVYSFLSDLARELSCYYSLPLLASVGIIFMSTLVISYLSLQLLFVGDLFGFAMIIHSYILIYPLFFVTTNVTAILNQVCIFFLTFAIYFYVIFTYVSFL